MLGRSTGRRVSSRPRAGSRLSTAGRLTGTKRSRVGASRYATPCRCAGLWTHAPGRYPGRPGTTLMMVSSRSRQLGRTSNQMDCVMLMATFHTTPVATTCLQVAGRYIGAGTQYQGGRAGHHHVP